MIQIELLEDRRLLSAVVAGGAHRATDLSSPAISVAATDITVTPVLVKAEANEAFFGDVGILGPGPVPFPIPLGFYHVEAEVDWGDGTAPSVGTFVQDKKQRLHVQAGHTYSSIGKYKVTVTVMLVPPPWSEAPIQIVATINSAAQVTPDDDADGSLIIKAKPGQSFSGSVGGFDFAGYAGAIAGTVFVATIDWGDGTQSDGHLVVRAPGEASVLGTHTYAKAGNYKIHTVVMQHDITMRPYIPPWGFSSRLIAEIVSLAIVES